MTHPKPSSIRRWLPLLIWMVVISLFSTDTFSGENTGSIIEPIIRLLLGKHFNQHIFGLIHNLIRKSAHVTEYLILGILLYYTTNPGLRRWRRKTALIVISLSIVYASLDEFHQTFTTTRTGSQIDVMIDSIGALIGIGFIWYYNKITIRLD